jgi:hypothetical protein
MKRKEKYGEKKVKRSEKNNTEAKQSEKKNTEAKQRTVTKRKVKYGSENKKIKIWEAKDAKKCVRNFQLNMRNVSGLNPVSLRCFEAKKNLKRNRRTLVLS